MKKLLLFAIFLYAQSGSAQLAGELGVLDPTFLTGINPGTGANWQAGDQYRLVFVTRDSSVATSTDITTYNTFVQGAANGSSLGLADHTGWKVIGSTATVNAIDNTGTASGGTMIPFILTDGMTVIKNNYSTFWGNHAAGEDIDLDENGNYHGTDVFAGSTKAGVAVGNQPLGGDAINGNGNASIGRTQNASGGQWIQVFNTNPALPRPFYAMSGPLTVCEQIQWFADQDNDGYPDGATALQCESPGSIWKTGDQLAEGPNTPIDCDIMDPNLTTPGNPCDDGDALTIEDFINDNCECVGGIAIPTLSQWGIIVLMIIMLIIGLVAVRRRSTVLS
jgi:hypothetical protein